MIIRKRFCDVCGNLVPKKSYIIGPEYGTYCTIDLCNACRDSLIFHINSMKKHVEMGRNCHDSKN